MKKGFFSRGFTLIELLVVIAIIGLLASVVLTALNTARSRARDARRLSDINQFKTGMDLFFNAGYGYPSEATVTAAAASNSAVTCSGTVEFKIPYDPLSTNAYTYTTGGNTVSGCGYTDLQTTYTLSFVLEKTALTYTMNENGQISPALPQL